MTDVHCGFLFIVQVPAELKHLPDVGHPNSVVGEHRLVAAQLDPKIASVASGGTKGVVSEFRTDRRSRQISGSDGPNQISARKPNVAEVAHDAPFKRSLTPMSRARLRISSRRRSSGSWLSADMNASYNASNGSPSSPHRGHVSPLARGAFFCLTFFLGFCDGGTPISFAMRVTSVAVVPGEHSLSACSRCESGSFESLMRARADAGRLLGVTVVTL